MQEEILVITRSLCNLKQISMEIFFTTNLGKIPVVVGVGAVVVVCVGTVGIKRKTCN